MIRHVDTIIIGAGMAGTVLARMLDSERVVVLDDRPGRYKIGESVIPEQFHHPVMASVLPHVRRLPSYAPKHGTTFVSGDSVASFSLPDSGAHRSMHVARHELEPLLHRLWDTPIVRERVLTTHPEARSVTTQTTTYVAEQPIVDCSGWSMVVARDHGTIDALWPTFCRWTYFDIADIDDAAFQADIRATHKRYLRFDPTHRQVLSGDESDAWSPTHTTILTALGGGRWTWQIPLFDRKLLSFGVVSTVGKLDDAALFETAAATHAAPYTLERRPLDDRSPYNRVHVRNGFARRARVSATRDYILVGDAYAFADPVYSVGTGLAVNKAIEVAAILNAGAWSDAPTRARFVDDYGRLIDRSMAAFEAWYEGSLLTDDADAAEVQESFLVGTAFQVGIATHYGQVLLDASPSLDADGLAASGRFAVDAAAAARPITAAVRQVLGLEPSRPLAGWSLDAAVVTQGGLQLRWTRDGKPDLLAVMTFAAKVTQFYRRVGDISLSFMNLFDGAYPFDRSVEALFDRLEEAVVAAPWAWKALTADAVGAGSIDP